MTASAVEFFATPGPMTVVPEHPALEVVPTDLDELRRTVQGLLVHRDWAALYGVPAEQARLDEQHLRSTAELLARAFELSDEPITVARAPVDRVLCICRHYTLLHTAFLRGHGVPARVRCGFSNYFDPAKWYDHWITERWDGARWVRDDPQIDELQADLVKLDFDAYDQPPGKFLTGAEAWIAARDGAIDTDLFGIFDMWGLAFIAGNVFSDLACLNKVEPLPWDLWGLGLRFGPHDPVPDDIAEVIDELSALVVRDDVEAVRDRYACDAELKVPADIVSFIDGEPVAVHLEL